MAPLTLTFAEVAFDGSYDGDSVAARGSGGSSSDEACASPAKRCRFGATPFNTVPATPMGPARAAPIGSPPGLSRKAMRSARDSVKAVSSTATARLTESAFSTVPKTPAAVAKLGKELGEFRSPPGLSRTQMRRERDACKGELAWGSSYRPNHAAYAGAKSPSKRQRAQKKLESMMEGALLLRAESSAEHQESLAGTVNNDDAAECMDKMAEVQKCRFQSSVLVTVPTTPAGRWIMPSPPGLSRRELREARDRRMSTDASAPR